MSRSAFWVVSLLFRSVKFYYSLWLDNKFKIQNGMLRRQYARNSCARIWQLSVFRCKWIVYTHFFFFNSVCGRLSLPLFCYYWSPDYQYVAGISCRFLSFSLFAPAELLFGKIHIQTTEIVCLPSKFKTNENIVIRRNWQIKLPIIVIIVTVTVAALCNPFIKSQ